MGFLNRTINKAAVEKMQRCVSERNKEQIIETQDTPVAPQVMKELKGGLDMSAIQAEAMKKHPKKSLDKIAYAVLKVAEVIQERLPDADVEYLIKPSDISDSVSSSALPIHFLFKKNGKPAVAVVINTMNGVKTPNVVKTRLFCEKNKIGYIRVYADGQWADWITGESGPITGFGAYGEHDFSVSEETVEYCKNWLVSQIQQYI